MSVLVFFETIINELHLYTHAITKMKFIETIGRKDNAEDIKLIVYRMALLEDDTAYG